MIKYDFTFKPIKGYENLYSININGDILRHPTTVINNKGIKNNIKGGILKHKINYAKYHYVALCKNGIVKWYFVHTLVANNFINNPNNLPLVNHKDKNPENNNVNNLEWCNHKYNANYSIKEIKNSHIGECISVTRIDKNGNKKLYMSMREAAKDNNLYHSNIKKAINSNFLYGGYNWEYTKLI